MTTDLTKELAAIQERHTPTPLYAVDTNGEPDLEEEPTHVACMTCTDEYTVEKIEDAEWDDSWPTIYWPCDAARSARALQAVVGAIGQHRALDVDYTPDFQDGMDQMANDIEAAIEDAWGES